MRKIRSAGEGSLWLESLWLESPFSVMNVKDIIDMHNYRFDIYYFGVHFSKNINYVFVETHTKPFKLVAPK